MKMLEGLNITKYYEDGKIIEDVSVYVNEGEMVALLGASGVGKTTLFNILSGLEMPDEGKVYLKGEEVPLAGKIGYMQQSDLLLSFKRVIDNVMVPLKLKRVSKKARVKRAEEILKEFGLFEAKDLFPGQLSGGMRQRAALARTFMMDNDVLLLDEPFSALDAITRGEMQKWFKETVKRHKLTTILITHDVDEAIELSDRIYVMCGPVGKITNEFKTEQVNKEELLEAVKGV